MKKKIFLAISYTKRQKVEKAISNFFEDNGFRIITGRKIQSGMNQGDEIKRIIGECEFGVVVYNELRHNISYEWGLLDALIGKDGHVFLFKDVNIHIDLDYEISDKKGTNFTHFYGEDREEEIIKSLEKNEGLMELIEKFIGEAISKDQTAIVKEAAKAIVSTNLPTKLVIEEGMIDSTYADLKNLKDKLSRVTNLTIEGHFYKSITHFHMKEFENAELEMKKVIELDSNNAAAHENLGVILSRLGRDEEAETEISIALSLNPESYQTHINLGIILMRLGKYKEAKTEINEAISLDKENALGYAVLGAILNFQEKLKDAEKALNTSLSLDPELSMALGILGIIYVRQKRFKEAEIKFKDELKLEPENVNTLSILGRLYIDMGQYDDAKKILNYAINIDPNNGSIRCIHGILLSKLNEDLSAENEFKKALLLDKKDISIKHDFGEFLLQKKRYNEAKKLFKDLIELNPNKSFGYERLGYIFVKQGNQISGKKMYQKSFDLDHHNISILISFGAVLANLGEYDDAKKRYNDAYKIEPENLLLLHNLSELYMITSKYVKSYETAKQGFEISKNMHDKILFKFWMFMNNVLLENNPDENEFTNFLKINKGYNINFKFETLKSGLRRSKYYNQLKKLIYILEKYSED
jgi:tetratricopeptide (TPR) repeat protein